MTDEIKEMDTKQEKALELALAGMSDVEIARRVRVSRQWVNRWRNHDEEFMEALRERRQALREQRMDRMTELMEEAIAAARGALRSPNENTRLKAAALVYKVSGLQGDMRADQ